MLSTLNPILNFNSDLEFNYVSDIVVGPSSTLDGYSTCLLLTSKYKIYKAEHIVFQL